MANTTSQHILNTSATLLGFCLFVITSLHIANQIETHLIDEFTSVVAVLLTFSCIISFISIRTTNRIREKRLETFADYLFVAALIGILIIILLITFNFIK
jgi:membrane protease YdiL (CAAX protease family)